MNAETTLSKIYNVLSEMKYPRISNVEPQNMQTTILAADDRIFLLTWLLTKNSQYLAEELNKLKGKELKDKVVQLFHESGICTNENILLGNCTMRDQLPMLRLLLTFIENTCKSSTSNHINDKPIYSEFEKCLTESPSVIPSSWNISKIMKSSAANKYFQNIQQDLSQQNPQQVLPVIKEPTPPSPIQEKLNESDKERLSISEKFIDSFSEFTALTTKTNDDEIISCKSMDPQIASITANFSILKQTLERAEKVSKTVIPQGLSATSTLLNPCIQDLIICMEKFSVMCSKEFD